MSDEAKAQVTWRVAACAGFALFAGLAWRNLDRIHETQEKQGEILSRLTTIAEKNDERSRGNQDVIMQMLELRPK